MNILVITAHPDDEAFGLGGTIAKHTAKGDNVYLCVLCKSVKARLGRPEQTELRRQMDSVCQILGIRGALFFDFPNIKMNTVPMLNVVQAIEKVIVKFRPGVVYTHHNGDVNDDHRIVFNATVAAVRLPERGNKKGMKRNMIKRVLTYEVPSSTEWALAKEDAFIPNVFVDVKKSFSKKIEAIKSYKQTIRPYPHPRSVEAIEILAKTRGIQSGLEYAEAFCLLKELVD